MRFATSCVVLLAALAVGCNKQAPQGPGGTAAAAKKIVGIPLTMTVKQRTTTTIPGTDDELSITFDDITRGQVMVSLLDTDGAAIGGPKSLRTGDALPFRFGETPYAVRVTELSNALIGDDFATFVIDVPTPGALTEEQKIARLISAVESLDKATFIRNDTPHTAKEAADHLHRKLSSAGKQIQTASDFIEQIASESSVSGEEYLVRMPDGRTLTTSEFLRQELSKLDQSR